MNDLIYGPRGSEIGAKSEGDIDIVTLNTYV